MAAHFLHVFATFVPAGPQVRVARLLSALGPEARHTIVSMDGRTEARALLDPGLDVRILEPPPRAGTLATVPRLARLFRRERPDLLLTYNWGALDALLAARWVGLRRVVHHEDGFRPDEARARKRRRSWARRLVLRGARRVVVISEGLRAIARAEWGLVEPRLVWIPNGIDVERFEAPAGGEGVRRELGIDPHAFVVGAVGHLRPEKRFDRLARALPAEGHLLILGEGPERARIEAAARAASCAERVHLPGYRQDLREWYGAMDAFALCSETEQAPIALLEAMAAGLPVVATDVGDVRAMLPPGAPGVVAQGPEDEVVSALGRALADLASDARERARRGAHNRARARERFGAQRMERAYCELYEAVLREP